MAAGRFSPTDAHPMALCILSYDVRHSCVVDVARDGIPIVQMEFQNVQGAAAAAAAILAGMCLSVETKAVAATHFWLFCKGL